MPAQDLVDVSVATSNESRLARLCVPSLKRSAADAGMADFSTDTCTSVRSDDAERLVGPVHSIAAVGYFCGEGPSSVLVDCVEELEELLGRSGGKQFVDLVGVREEDRDPAEDVHVAPLVTGDAHGEPYFVTVPVDR